MSIRLFVCILLLGVASAQAAPAKKKPQPEAPPQEIDVDAMARAKDASAQPTEPPPPPGQADAEHAASEAASTASEPAAAAEAAAAGAAQATSAPTAATDTQSKPESAPKEGKAGSLPQDALALTPPIDPQEKRIAAGCESRATRLLDAAQKGDFAAATKDFDAKMRSTLKPEKLKEMWNSLAQFGTLEARGQPHPSKGEGYYLVMTPLIFQKQTLVSQVACGSDGRVAGFYIKPLSALQQ